MSPDTVNICLDSERGRTDSHFYDVLKAWEDAQTSQDTRYDYAGANTLTVRVHMFGGIRLCLRMVETAFPCLLRELF
jgi:hypothetical protein